MPIVRMLGSSPLTRGKLSSAWEGIKSSRLIPAHAGKTAWLPALDDAAHGSSPLTRGKPDAQVSNDHATKAHPRSRGENSKTRAEPPTWPGSSPLTRGKQQVTKLRLSRTGLIPAHAGKTGTVTRRGR